MRKVAVIVVIAIVAAAAAFQFTKPRTSDYALARLKESYKSAGKPEYVGSVITTAFYCGSELRTESVVRHNASGERIEYLSGPANGATVIVRNGETRTYSSNGERILVSSAADGPTDKDLDLLLKNYGIINGGRDSVAGRAVDVVMLRPMHKGNPSKRLWIDKETGVVLKSEDRTSGGHIRSMTEFTKIDYSVSMTDSIFNAPAAHSAASAPDTSPKLTLAEVRKAVGVAVSLPKYVPEGYVLGGISTYKCKAGCGHNAAHLRYTNGLNSISIFQLPTCECCDRRSTGNCDAAGVCTIRDARQAQVGTAVLPGRSVIVVADLPEEVITKVVKSIQ